MLTSAQISTLRARLEGRPFQLCFGSGVDSTAMIVAIRQAGLIPDVITFANPGAEKPEAYAHLVRMQGVIREWAGWPAISFVQHKTKADTGYTTITGELEKNQTLPALAFGQHSCSIKWKIEVQDRFILGSKRGTNKCEPHPVLARARSMGVKIIKLIGYDAGPADTRRSNKSHAGSNDENFELYYPLQDLGWTRGDCVAAIAEDLGPQFVPVKSACFFCPASQKWELYWLAGTHPQLFERALRIEHTSLNGRHKDAYKSTKGLGRKWSWNEWAVTNGVVDALGNVLRSKADEFLAIASRMMAADNALDGRSC